MASVARKDGYKQAAQARRLLANVSVAQHVLAGTVTDEYFPVEQSVSYRIASEDFQAGALHISRRQGYYLVECQVAPGRYYVVVRNGSDYQCSIANDARLLAKLSVKVIEYRTAPVLAEAEDVAEVASKELLALCVTPPATPKVSGAEANDFFMSLAKQEDARKAVA